MSYNYYDDLKAILQYPIILLKREPNMNIKPRVQKIKFPKAKQPLTQPEVDFLKSRFSTVISAMENRIVEIRDHAKTAKILGLLDVSDKWYNMLKKEQQELKKLAGIQSKFKQGI